MTSLTKITKATATTTLPAAANPTLIRAKHRCLSGATMGAGGRLVLLHDLDPTERRMAEHRLSTLRASLAERDNRAVAAAVAQLLAGYGSSRSGPDEARATLAAYVAVLDDVPVWAATEACRAWPGEARARASAFAPSTEELHKAAASVARRYQAEADELASLLNGKAGEPEVSPAERQRVAAGWEKLKAEIAMPKPVDAA